MHAAEPDIEVVLDASVADEPLVEADVARKSFSAACNGTVPVSHGRRPAPVAMRPHVPASHAVKVRRRDDEKQSKEPEHASGTAIGVSTVPRRKLD